MAQGDETLKPVLPSGRTLSYTMYALALASNQIALYSFMTGAGAIAAGLNVAQALLACTLAVVVWTVMMVLNGIPGFRLGIPMVVQMRPCFGEKFTILAASLRAIPAIAWTGYNSFMGAVGLNLFSILLFGYNNVWVWFFVFHFAQVILSALGVKKMLDFAAYAAIALLVIIVMMAIYIFDMYGLENIMNNMVSEGGSSRVFWYTFTVNISLGVTGMVNASDYLRQIDNSSVPKLVASYAWGLIPSTLILAGLGMIVASLTGIWSPVDLFVKYVPSVLVVAIAMCFIILGQFSTNMFANIIPANIVWGSLFKFPWWFSSVFTGCLSLFIIPWYLTSSSGFFTFMNFYGATLGPVAGILFTDFFLVRKGKYNIQALYAKNSQYTYSNGFNASGVIALVVGSVVAFWQLEFSAIFGGTLAGAVYYFCYRFITVPKYPQAELQKDYKMESSAVVHEMQDTYYI